MYFLWFLLISGKQIWGRRVRVQHPGSGAAYKFLSRLKQICECQVWTTLYTLHSQFIDSMSTNSMFQLARLLTCSGAVPVLRLLPGWPAGRSSTPSTGILIPCSETGGWCLLQTFWLLRWLRTSWREPTTLEDLKMAQVMLKLSLKPRRRRIRPE